MIPYYKTNFLKIFFGLIVLVATLSLSGCGVSSNSNPTSGTSKQPVLGKAILGNLSNATVRIFKVKPNGSLELLYKERTSGGESLDEIGLFNTHANELNSNEIYVFKVSGGCDWDADDNGEKDTNCTINKGEFHAIAKGQDIKELGKSFTISPITELQYRTLYNYRTNKKEFDTKKNELAELVAGDINNDGKIDYKDIYSFIPNNQEHIEKLPQATRVSLGKIAKSVESGTSLSLGDITGIIKIIELSNKIEDIAVNSNGKNIFIATYNSIKVFNCKNNEEHTCNLLDEYQLENGEIETIECLKDNYLAVLYQKQEQKSILILKLSNGTIEKISEINVEADPYHLKFFRDKNLLFAYSSNCNASVFSCNDSFQSCTNIYESDNIGRFFTEFGPYIATYNASSVSFYTYNSTVKELSLEESFNIPDIDINNSILIPVFDKLFFFNLHNGGYEVFKINNSGSITNSTYSQLNFRKINCISLPRDFISIGNKTLIYGNNYLALLEFYNDSPVFIPYRLEQFTSYNTEFQVKKIGFDGKSLYFYDNSNEIPFNKVSIYKISDVSYWLNLISPHKLIQLQGLKKLIGVYKNKIYYIAENNQLVSYNIISEKKKSITISCCESSESSPRLFKEEVNCKIEFNTIKGYLLAYDYDNSMIKSINAEDLTVTGSIQSESDSFFVFSESSILVEEEEGIKIIKLNDNGSLEEITDLPYQIDNYILSDLNLWDTYIVSSYYNEEDDSYKFLLTDSKNNKKKELSSEDFDNLDLQNLIGIAGENNKIVFLLGAGESARIESPAIRYIIYTFNSDLTPRFLKEGTVKTITKYPHIFSFKGKVYIMEEIETEEGKVQQVFYHLDENNSFKEVGRIEITPFHYPPSDGSIYINYTTLKDIFSMQLISDFQDLSDLDKNIRDWVIQMHFWAF